MIKKETKTIPGKVNGEATDIAYECEQFPAMKGIRIAVQLAKIFGGGLGEAASGGLDKVMDMDVGAVVNKIVGNLDEDSTTKLISDLLSRTTRQGVQLNVETIDVVYAGNFAEMIDALKFVLEVNFGGFMGALAQAGDIGKK